MKEGGGVRKRDDLGERPLTQDQTQNGRIGFNTFLLPRLHLNLYHPHRFTLQVKSLDTPLLQSTLSILAKDIKYMTKKISIYICYARYFITTLLQYNMCMM